MQFYMPIVVLGTDGSPRGFFVASPHTIDATDEEVAACRRGDLAPERLAVINHRLRIQCDHLRDAEPWGRC